MNLKDHTRFINNY